jgi:hypothetical protein
MARRLGMGFGIGSGGVRTPPLLVTSFGINGVGPGTLVEGDIPLNIVFVGSWQGGQPPYHPVIHAGEGDIVLGETFATSLPGGTQFNYNSAGTYIARLDVTDAAGKLAHLDCESTVKADSPAISVTFNPIGDLPAPAGSIDFTIDANDAGTHVDGGMLTINWGDGGSLEGPNLVSFPFAVSHNYGVGTYTATATVQASPYPDGIGTAENMEFT